MGKVWVKVKYDIHQEPAKTGDIGFITGYVKAADDRPYCVVAIRDFLSFIPIYALVVLPNYDQEIPK